MLLNTIKDRNAHQVCNLLLQEAIIQIRATAYLQKRVGWSIGDVDINEEIRRLADLCDGLAGSESGAAGRLKYRLSVLSEDQACWVRSVLSARGVTL
jgi:hypothetical protein